MTSSCCRDSSVTDIGSSELEGMHVSPDMLVVAIKAIQPFTEEDGVLSTSVMHQAIRAALAAALRCERPVSERRSKVSD